MWTAARAPGAAAEARRPPSYRRPRRRGPGHPIQPSTDYKDSVPCGAWSSPPHVAAEGITLRSVAPLRLPFAGALLAGDRMRQPRAVRLAALRHGDVGVAADWRRTVGRCARAGRCGRLGREGRGKPGLRPIPLESCHVGALVISHGGADLAGDPQEHRDVLRAEAVIAALLEEEAEAGASAECVDFVAHAAFAHVTHPAGACGDGEGTDLDRWGCCGHLCSSSGGRGRAPPGGRDAWGRRDALPLQ